MAKRGFKAPSNYMPRPKKRRERADEPASGDYRDRIGRGKRADAAARDHAAEREREAREARGGRSNRTSRERSARPSERADATRGAVTRGRGGRTGEPAASAGHAPGERAGSRRNSPHPTPRRNAGDERPIRLTPDPPRPGQKKGRSAPRNGERVREDVVLERLDATLITPEEAEGVAFADLGLDDRLVAALAELGATEPFPIQVATIPDIVGGRNVLGRGRTGSGKTIAFGAGLVQRLLAMGGQQRKQIGRAPRALILANTRELALQIDRTVQPLARAVGLYTAQLYGGVPYAKQQTALKRGVDIVIGTPGRIEDLVARDSLDLSRVVVTVLDEADEMCDMGFLEPVERILEATKANGQRLLFSATLDAAVMRLVRRYLPEPAVHEVAGEHSHSDIEHRVLVVDRRDKEAVMAQLAGSGGKVLVFVRTRATAEKYAAVLADYGVAAVALHGDLSQVIRAKHLAELTTGKVDVLVATDVAARGIHVDDIRLVVQADPPDEYKSYLHRAGRTGRAGNRGTVVTLIAPTRRTRMQELLERAQIEADLIPAAPGGRELDEFMA